MIEEYHGVFPKELYHTLNVSNGTQGI